MAISAFQTFTKRNNPKLNPTGKFLIQTGEIILAAKSSLLIGLKPLISPVN
jgi:hypothetical protein